MTDTPVSAEKKDNIVFILITCIFFFYLSLTNLEKYKNISEKKNLYMLYIFILFISIIVGATTIFIMFDIKDD